MTDPRTDRARLTDHAYRTSAPLLARTDLYRYQRDAVDLPAWVLGLIEWPGDARVLDVGCGPGRYISKLAELVPDARSIGIDLSPGMSAEARSISPVTVGDAQALPFARAEFDVVIAAHMLYHVPDIGAAVREFARVVRPTGRALVVLNGREHLRDIWKLIGASLRDIVGVDYVVPARSSSWLQLEHASPHLSGLFHVDRCERVTRMLDVPVAQPVVDYVDSMRSFYEPILRRDITWKRLMERVAARVEAAIEADGVWRARSDVGCFVCRPR